MDESHPYAFSFGKRALYKFRAYRTQEDKRRVAQILTEHKVYFARASQLNDPFDMSPRFQVIESREELLAAARSFCEREPGLAYTVDLDYLATCDVVEHAQEATAAARKRMDEQYPVLSLAGNNTHPMLWSHYADGHTGVCIHFKADEHAGWFGFALKVEYVDIRPLLPATVRTLSDREIFERIALRKGSFWRYEDEYRWIMFPDTHYVGVKFRKEGQFGLFRASALEGISLGARMPKDNVAALVSVAKKHVPALPVWQAREKDSYDFEFERLA